jgi:16S rRNA (uracil1498-N3)-methyltransferase
MVKRMPGDLRVAVSSIEEGETLLDEESSHYVTRVHRAQPGAFLLLFDPTKAEQARAEFLALEGRRVLARIAAVERAPSRNMPVRLLQGLGKGDKPEQAVRDATALGAQELVFLLCQRSVAKGSGATRTDRLLRVSEQVARQCQRPDLPLITGPLAFSDGLLLEGDDAARRPLRLICEFAADAQSLIQRLIAVDWSSQSVDLLIGPEGGFDPGEVQFAREQGFTPVSLGPYVLRTESACVFALSVLCALHAAHLHS